MRISKIRLAKLETMVRGQVVINDKADELRQRMEAAQARADKYVRDKLTPAEYEEYISSREVYYEAYHQRCAELRTTMPCNGIAERFKISRLASKWARQKTGFRRPNV